MTERYDMNKKIPLIALIAGITTLVIIAILIIILAYMMRQPDVLLAIEYVCTTGLKPNLYSTKTVYNNGTHVIDMITCRWIESAVYTGP